MDTNADTMYGRTRRYAGDLMSSIKSNMNGHNVMLVIAVIILLIAFVWLIGLSGVQTGSSTTSGFGSIVLSSQLDDGTVNPTYEVVAEFFIALFLIIGVGMLAYVLTVKRVANKLIDEHEYYSALVVNGKKDVSKDLRDESLKQQAQNEITLLGLPTTTIADGIRVAKNRTVATGNAIGGAFRGAASGAYRGAADAYNRSVDDRSSKDDEETDD